MERHLKSPHSVLLLLSGMILNLSCGELPGLMVSPTLDLYSQEPEKVNKIDILFVVDNSNSMAQEQQNLSDSFGRFIDQFAAKNMDFQIGIISTDVLENDNWWNNQICSPFASVQNPCSQYPYQGILNDGPGSLLAKTGNPKIITPSTPDYINVFKQNVLLSIHGNGGEAGLRSAMMALDPLRLEAGGYNEGFVRDEAYLAVIVVSDEDEAIYDDLPSSNPMNYQYYDYIKVDPVLEAARIENFKNALYSLKPNREDTVRFSAIVAPSVAECPTVYPGRSVNGQVGLYGNGVGDTYMKAAEELGGKVANICSDFSDSLEELGDDFIQMIRRFKLKSNPNGNKIIVSVNGVLVPEEEENGWSYDEVNNEIVFNGSAVPSEGASIKIIYVPSSASN